MFSLGIRRSQRAGGFHLRPAGGEDPPGGKFKLADELRYVAPQLDAEGRLDPEFQPLRTSRISMKDSPSTSPFLPTATPC